MTDEIDAPSDKDFKEIMAMPEIVPISRKGRIWRSWQND